LLHFFFHKYTYFIGKKSVLSDFFKNIFKVFLKH
jgi:hypothetical protein